MATELVDKIIKQIEYYFGDINLSRDKFLRDLIGKEDGWIPITTLLTFKRLQAITEKESDIVSAFEEGKSQIIELNEAKDKLRRSKPLPDFEDEEYKKQYRLRTVHLKGFPKEGTTLDELIEYSSQYGVVESVKMRRFEDKTFKGCCMATFQSVESANKAISSNDLFKGETELKLRENQETYLKRKKNSKKGDFKKEKKLINLSVNDNKTDVEKTDDAKKTTDDAEKTTDNQENKNETETNDKVIDEQEVKVQDQEMSEQNDEKKSELVYEKGCVLKFFDLPEDIKFWQIKNALKEHGSVKFVDLYPEKKTGIARFASKEDADKALKALAYEDTEKVEQNVETSENDQTEENGTKTSEENDQTSEAKSSEEIGTKTAEENDQTSETKASEENEVKNSDDQKNEENQENKPDEVMTNEESQKIIKKRNHALLKKMKIDDNIILSYDVLEGVEEDEYWLKFRNFNNANRESNNRNHHKKPYHNNNRRFGGYKNNNKRSSNNDRNNSKRLRSNE